jgi:phage baseplate assembly protein W
MDARDDAPADRRAFLGIGWKFPLQVSAQGRIAQARHEQRIEESIVLILSTAPGERPMLPGFGCGIHDALFAPGDPRSVALVAHLVREALTRYEARIDLLDVRAESSPEAPNLLLIRIHYRIRATNAVGNLVYPFYIKEGR